MVILGSNCLFELPSPKAQEECILRASEALVPGGRLFVDNNDTSGHSTSLSDIGTSWTALEGTGTDGTYGKLSARVVDIEADTGITHLIRTWESASGERDGEYSRVCRL